MLVVLYLSYLGNMRIRVKGVGNEMVGGIGIGGIMIG